jgi:capsular exopolysaccharide synthesis family protein
MFASLAVALPPGIGMGNPMTDYEAYRGPAWTDRQSPPPQALSFRKGTRLLWRHKAIILISMAVGLSIAFLVRSQTIPRYEAEAQIVLDVRSTKIMKFDAVVSGLLPQPEVIHTEMDIIASRGMAERVLDHLPPGDVKQLGDDGAMTTPMSRFFTETWPGILNQLVEWMPLLKQAAAILSSEQMASPSSELISSRPPDRDYLVSLIMQGLKVSNDGRSYTIHIAFASPNPHIAAAVANTYARQYMANTLDMKADATARANELLSQRLVELRRELEVSETAVETYRRAGGMLGDQAGTIITQQLSQTNAELAVARNQRIEAESHLQVVQAEIRSGGDLKALSDVLTSQVVQSLLTKQAELRRQQAQLNSQYTAKYPKMKSLQTDVATLQAQISAEINRVVSGLVNEVDIARHKEAGLQQDLKRLERQFGQGGEAEVKLQQLQRESDANRTVYEAYLNRLKEVTEQQQLQVADAYIVSLATQPTVPAYPRYRPLLLLGLVIGGIAGVSIAFLRDISDQHMRSIGQVEEVTGIPVVALMPSLPWHRLARPENYVLRPGRRSSKFNEALRSAWAAVLLARPPVEVSQGSDALALGFQMYGSTRQPGLGGKVILVTSSVPNEGKTAFCLSMARSLAADGHKVLLIDADLRRPGVARCFGGSSTGRMMELLEGKIRLEDAIQIDQRSGAHYLAAGSNDVHPQDVLNSRQTNIVLDEARRSYDIVLIDTPPILVAADAALIAGLSDCCLFFIRWGTTSREQVVSALRRLALYNVKVSGTILSHVNLRRHAQFAAGEGYYRSYGRLPSFSR